MILDLRNHDDGSSARKIDVGGLYAEVLSECKNHAISASAVGAFTTATLSNHIDCLASTLMEVTKSLADQQHLLRGSLEVIGNYVNNCIASFLNPQLLLGTVRCKNIDYFEIRMCVAIQKLNQSKVIGSKIQIDMVYLE